MGASDPQALCAENLEAAWSEALQESHLALSATDFRFREIARQSPDLLRRSTFDVLHNDLRLYYPQQPWPTFVGRAKLEEVKRVSLALASLIRSVPHRIFQNDPAKVCDFYRLPSHAAADIILSQPNCVAESMARADLIDTSDGLKCIEFNFTPNLGGWETSLLAELLSAVPAISSFIAREGIRYSYTPTLRVMFRDLIRQTQNLQLCQRGEFNVACALDREHLELPGIRSTLELFQRELEASLREAASPWRGTVVGCLFSQLLPAQGKLFYGKLQVHVVLELGLGLAPAAVYRSFKAGKILLFNGPITEVLTDKRNLALLSENEGRGMFDPREREVIRNHIPWTRLVSAETVEFEGEEVFLPDLLASERDRLVLKEGKNYGGKGVSLGRFTSSAQWEERVRSALAAGDWVVQERLESLPYLYQCGDYGCAPHDVIWGPFVCGDTYAGLCLRMQPKSAGGAVNLSLAATQGLVLEV